MGRALIIHEEDCRNRGKMCLFAESLRKTYTHSVKEALRAYEFNFVISDPRLPENPIVYASEGFCKMSGYSWEEVLGRNCRFLQGPDTDRRTVLELRDAIREERSAQVQILNYTKERKPFWNLFYLAPVFSKVDGTVIHFVGVQTPISSQLATSLPEKERILSRLTADSEPSRNSSRKVHDLNHFHANEEFSGIFRESEFLGADTPHSLSSGISNLERNRNFSLSCPSMDDRGEENGTEQAVTAYPKGEGEPHACKSQEPESLKAMDAMRRLVSQLVESSKEKAGVLENRGKQLFESTAAGVVSSSLMLSLTRIQQSFVLADPHLPDSPIVHASDLFLHLTGYDREEVVGRNCRFLQGADTDRASVAQIRESMRLEKSCSVRLLNYRKDRRPFWNLLHVSPIRSSRGKVAYFIGVQLQVSAANEEEETTGISAQMKQLSAVGAVRVAVRSLQGTGLRRTIRSAII